MTWLDTLINEAKEAARHKDADVSLLVREHSKDYLRIIISTSKNYVFVVRKDEELRRNEKT